jgi:hypothetical protein
MNFKPFALLLGMALTATAAVPGATAQGEAGSDPYICAANGAHDLRFGGAGEVICKTSNGIAEAGATIGPTVGVGVSATLDTLAISSAAYCFEIVGPESKKVDVFVRGTLATGLTNPPTYGMGGIASAFAEVWQDETLLLNVIGCSNNIAECDDGQPMGTQVTGEFKEVLRLESNVIYFVEIGAAADPNGGANAGATAGIKITYIQIAPAFAMPNPEYSVVVSAGVTNGPVATTAEHQ